MSKHTDDDDAPLDRSRERERVAAAAGTRLRTCGKIIAGATNGTAPCRLAPGHDGRCVPAGAPQTEGERQLDEADAMRRRLLMASENEEDELFIPLGDLIDKLIHHRIRQFDAGDWAEAGRHRDAANACQEEINRRFPMERS